MKRFLIFVVVGLFAGLLMAQEAYRWVDEEGNVHYSDQPPPEDEQDAERVRLDAGTRADDIDEAIEDEELEEDEDGGPILSEEECAALENRLAEMREADVLYELGEDGEQEELDPEAAAEEIRRLQDRIDAYCE